ncbi:hypothetical protein [Yeosuana sp.]|uniref:hypothetical protein n=1 Tax=Yeosuana sp. TaxID=2529388 RepID=UPI004054E9D2|tara:strand:- start:40 stop:459 length:420 start_codon:yes stop_codon:yes gene_type:complete
MKLHKYLKYVAYALGIIGTLFALLLIAGNDSMIDNLLYVLYVVLGLVLVLVLIYVLKGLFAGNLKKTLITVGLFLGILVISYIMSSGTDLNLEPFNAKGLNITEAISKNIGAGLNAFYFLIIIAIGSTLLPGVKNIFKK